MTTISPAPPAGPLPAPPRPSGWTTGRVVSLVLGCLATLTALGLLVGGVGLLAADHVARDDQGFLTTPNVHVGTTSYAITTQRMDMGGGGMMHGGAPGSSMPGAMMGELQITAAARGAEPVFLGIAPTVDVDRYLGSVRHCMMNGFGHTGGCSEIGGGKLATPPTATDIWVLHSSGTGPQTLTWSPQSGDWTAVVMNADGSPAVQADVRVGAEVPALPWVSGVLLTLAALVGTGAAFLVVVPLRRVAHEKRT